MTPIRVGRHIASRGPPYRHADVDRPRSGGNRNGQRKGTMVVQARTSRATIASAAVRSLSLSSSPDEGAVQSEPSFFFLQRCSTCGVDVLIGHERVTITQFQAHVVSFPFALTSFTRRSK